MLHCRIDANGLIKVADFGLAEDIYIANYYHWKKGDGTFTEKSDVVSTELLIWYPLSYPKLSRVFP